MGSKVKCLPKGHTNICMLASTYILVNMYTYIDTLGSKVGVSRPMCDAINVGMEQDTRISLPATACIIVVHDNKQS